MIFAMIKRWQDEQERLDFRAGVIAATIANVNRDPKRQRQAFEPRDFMPRLHREPPPKPMSVEQSVQYVAILNAAFGGVDLRKAA